LSTTEPADWDAVDQDEPDPEDTADRDGIEIDPDDVAEEVAGDSDLDVEPRYVEETIPWQDYNRPVPD
jgi:hypothetical protein